MASLFFTLTTDLRPRCLGQKIRGPVPQLNREITILEMNPPKKKKVKPKKKRKVWEIKPVTRVHDEKGYKRKKAKKELDEDLKEE